MKNCILSLILSCGTLSLFSGNDNGTNKHLFFTENKGQISDQFHKPRPDVLFSATDGQLTFHFKNDGVSYQQYKVTEWLHEKDVKTGQDLKIASKTLIQRLDIEWLNANKASIIKTSALAEYSNYYFEVCPTGVHNVLSYQEISYKNLYNGIDLKWYQKDNHIKYDYIVSPGANPSDIKLKIQGAQNFHINKAGELVITTSLGPIIEEAPYVFQNNKRINASWKLNGNVVSFSVSSYDKTKELVIDPGVRLWGTYYGGSSDEIGAGCVVDGSNTVYLSGYTDSSNGTSIATVGSFLSTYGGGVNNAYLAKFDGSGNRIWATYYGGAVREIGTTCAVDPSGNIYMSGHSQTPTSGVIATPGAHQTVHGGNWDAFLVKFNSAGVRQWGTYYGDPGIDFGYCCTTDIFGNAYLVGKTNCPGGSIIASAGSYQTTYGGFEDAFIVKFSPTGVRQWGTYFGGESADVAFGCTTDANGNIYLAGHTGSTLNISSPGSHQTSHYNVGAGWDAFLTKFNTNGFPIWSTYYGGNADDYGFCCAVDGSNNVYLCGKTNSTNNIGTDGAHQSVFGGGNFDAYLVKFNSNGVRTWGTYYGGAGEDCATSCAVNVVDYPYLAGYAGTGSGGTVIATSGSHQQTYGGSVFDSFISQFNLSGNREWGTYYGSTNTDLANFICTDKAYNFYVAGLTDTFTSTDIATVGSHQQNYGGGFSDGYFVKFYDCTPPGYAVNATPAANINICTGNSALLSATGSGTISWYASPTAPSALGTGTNYSTPVLSTGTYTYYAEANSCTVSPGRTPVTLTVHALPAVFVGSSNTLICSGDSAVLSAAGVPNYTWSTGVTTSTAMVKPTTTTVYTVTGASAYGCINTATIVQSVTVCVSGIANQQKNNSLLSIYPNPSHEFVVIKGISDKVKISLFNVLGEVILNEETTDSEYKIDVKKFSRGIYFIKINEVGKESTFKIIRD